MKDGYHHGNLKQALIEAGIQVISEKGFDALSLRAISAYCGVSHNAVYRHFDSKERLIAACREFVTAQMMEQLNAVLSETGDAPGPALYRLSAAYVSFYQRHPTYYSFLYRNSGVRLIFTMEETDENYPPLELFRRLYCRQGSVKGWTQEEALTHLTRLWSLLHGLTALIISDNVTWDGNWRSCLENIIE